eukprot:COSAG01_NODE_2640_length_7295_cov_4.485955_6_plen_144_part_00
MRSHARALPPSLPPSLPLHVCVCRLTWLIACSCKNATGCVSGFAINNANRVPASGEALSLPLKRGIDSSIDIAVWTDHTVIEFFVMSGRGYWTVPLSCDSLTNNTAQGISVFAEDGTNMLKNLTVWSVNSIWTEDADCGDNCS